MKKLIIGASALALGLGASAGTVDAANQRGLVNVYASDTTIQVPVAVAANICGVAVNVLTGPTAILPVDCTADGVAIAQDSGGGSGANQNGLVNVQLVDTTVQVPVAIAADVCGVSVNALATLIGHGPVDCDAVAVSSGG